ncbi:protein gar2-like [Phaseolus vulgaris]|uniref:protein gar2-like n=1 Tax=Phaseolus vulgaris TaxID=3885 RepID=UPI0035C9DB6C
MKHELELKRLKEQETTERKPKGLALKASELNEIKEEKEDADDDETIYLLTKRFNKFLKKKSRDRNQQKRSKRVERSKGRRAYISWEENEVSSTSSSSTENEENNMCFIMKDEESISDSVSEFSVDSDNYDQLLAAFMETHDEANRLAMSNKKNQCISKTDADDLDSNEFKSVLNQNESIHFDTADTHAMQESNVPAAMAFVSQVEPKNLNEALKDSNRILAMQEELNQFALNEEEHQWNLSLAWIKLDLMAMQKAGL